ncbi:vacuolar cation channel [Ascodesmis nigricans]|uniref:Vacuolar cation channel n=1 Tax=Ascodesmis nigricans TaxID=341454 RepID=A0A4S2MJD1_9PEZI|nr:vacuolar cation channel [Ascodesmis nigricans]
MARFSFTALAGIGRSFADRGRHASADFRENLLPHHRVAPGVVSALPAKEVTLVALRLKHLIEAAVPCELKQTQITRPHSEIITRQVVLLAREAGGSEYGAAVVFCLIVCLRWFKRQAILELYDADLNNLRAEACQVIAKQLIEMEEDQDYLFSEILLKRYSIIRNGQESSPVSVVERAIDLHATRIIGSSGFQKCIGALWKGWVCQDLHDPMKFTHYHDVANKSFWAHFDHDRIRAPRYQNMFQVFVSFLFLILYTISVNTVNARGDIDIEEGILYILTASFILDELVKFWKVGRYYIGFWNVFNMTLYTLLTVSFALRMIALSHPLNSDGRKDWNMFSYNFLAFVAPMIWSRMLLYLDSIRFFGAMLVVLKVMMLESVIFFALLVVVILGFLQGFIGLDAADNFRDDTYFVLSAMGKAILQSPEFEGFDNFGHPFGLILYYLFTFIVMVILLNILIALYGQAYSDITENATDEYLALFAHKTLQFVRAPDENVFLPPYNLIETFFLILPFEWWLTKAQYARLNDWVMRILYSPFMLCIAWLESHEARKVSANRARGEADDDSTEEWEELANELDMETSGWDKRVVDTVPDVEEDKCCQLVRELQKEVKELREMVEKKKDVNGFAEEEEEEEEEDED